MLKNADQRKLLTGLSILLFGLFGVALLIITKAAPFTASLQPEDGSRNGANIVTNSGASGGKAISFGSGGSASCGKRVQNYSYQVPFGNAVWNQPVCNLPRHTRSADYASRFIDWSHVNDGVNQENKDDGYLGVWPGYPGTPTLTDPEGLASLFSREVYYASEATTQAKVASILYPSNLDGTQWNDNENFPRDGHQSKHPENTIPWNPNWKTGMGGDNEIFIIDDRPGKNNNIYTIWGYNAAGCITDAIFFPNRVCGLTINISRDHWGNPINIKTHEGYVSERGAGISYYAGLVTPEEVKAGEIRHAIGIAIPNSSYGPICSKSQLGTSAEGNTCGTAVAPASKFEWGGNTSPAFMQEPFKSIYTLNKTIPEGMRFALDITDAQIETWINSRSDLKNNPGRAQRARVFARALKDYGFMIVDTSGAYSGMQLVGGVNPKHRAMWTELDMGPEYDENLLSGLISRENLYVVDPPSLTCADGTTSKNYCLWTSAKY